MSDILVLLLTDIVDSTQINMALGDELMAHVWQAHDQVSRELARGWSGLEIGRTDGFLLLFPTVADAVGFAAQLHPALQRLSTPLKARVGVHRGPAELRENSAEDRARGATPYQVDGAALPITARIMSLALGGQTLLSVAAANSLGPTALRTQCHGFWRLKGLSEPEELFEAGAADAPFVPPPDSAKAYAVVRANGQWLPRHELRNSLPVNRDEFVGRAAVLQTLWRRFDGGARLVSILGIGGTGKTRLAVQYGWSWLGDFPGGVWFCDLSQARGIDGIVQAVAQGLQVPLGPADPVVQLARALAGREPCLVILDNFEQVGRYADATLGHWLDHARNARFIVTTRELLGITGEEILALPPLAKVEAIDLFSKRAGAIRPDFVADAAQQAPIERLVELLDRLPLAIELAAARTLAMSPATLLDNMDDRFRLLATRGGRQDRQSTLRKTFDWSWDLLTDDDKSALAQLAVFEGGFTLAAADAVFDLSAGGAAPWTMDVVQSLVEKSLVSARSDERFDLLGTVQEYAGEHLCNAGRFPGSGPLFAAAARARHYRYFAGLDEHAAVAQRCIEIGNLDAACRRAAAQGDVDAALGALAGAWAALKLRGPFRGGVELAGVVAAMPGLLPGQRAVTDWVAGSALYSLGESARARERLDAGLVAARASGDERQQSRLLSALGEWFSSAGSGDDARACLDEALTLAQALEDTALQLTALNGLGALAHDQARMHDARAFYETALALARELGDLRWQGGLLGNLGGLLHGQGRLDLARSYYEQAIERSRQSGDRRWEGSNSCNLGLLHFDQGRHEEARVQFEAALVTARELGHPRLEGVVLCNLGIVAEAQGQLNVALTYQERAVGGAQALGDRHSQGQFRVYLGRLYTKLDRPREARECLLLGETQLIETGDQLSLGLLLCGLAELEFIADDRSLAMATLARAEAIASEFNADPESELGLALTSCRRRVG